MIIRLFTKTQTTSKYVKMTLKFVLSQTNLHKTLITIPTLRARFKYTKSENPVSALFSSLYTK